jgi:DNA-directed RNA polymerase specialized sigma24 family protein
MQDPHELLPLAYRAASRVVRNQVLAEEAGERAVHLLTLAVLDGAAPKFPKAWLCTVARRSACALLRSEWARTQSIHYDDLVRREAPYRLDRRPQVELVRERVEDTLTPRQKAAFHAALSSNTTAAAARRCGMPVRDFRRSLGAITRKARRAFASFDGDEPFPDDPAAQPRFPA